MPNIIFATWLLWSVGYVLAGNDSANVAEEIPLPPISQPDFRPEKVLEMKKEGYGSHVLATLSADGKKIVAVGKNVFVWEIGTWNLIRTFPCLSGDARNVGPRQIAISEDEKKLAIYVYAKDTKGIQKGTIEIYGLISGALERSILISESLESIRFLSNSYRLSIRNRSGGETVLDLSNGGEGLVVGPFLVAPEFSDTDDAVAIYKNGDDRELRLRGLDGAILRAKSEFKSKLAPFGKSQAAFVNEENEVLVWNLKDRKQIALPRGSYEKLLEIRFSPDGKRIVGISSSGEVFSWDLETKKINRKPSISASPYEAVFSDDLKYAFVPSADQAVKVWELERPHSAGSAPVYDSGTESKDAVEIRAHAAQRALEQWIHLRRMKMIDTMSAEREVLTSEKIRRSSVEWNDFFSGFQSNPDREMKACLLSRASLNTSEPAVLVGLAKIGVTTQSRKRLSRDMVLDAAGMRVRDYLIEHFLDTKCGKTQAFDRLDRLSIIECDLSLERVKEQIKDGMDVLEKAKLTSEEKALVYMNLALQYKYAFYVAPEAQALSYKNRAIEAYRTITALFPETRQLTEACVEELKKGAKKHPGSCSDEC